VMIEKQIMIARIGKMDAGIHIAIDVKKEI
jgi:hypothetical protein